ncbi:MAG TPA: NAD(P)-dependent oxidoreductase [Acidimicrobiales bacterium]|nr:NAD(P)-dependent oxidoreductase [Acidimicrobiales bacterium]
MKVLFMAKPGNSSPWYEEFVAAIRGEIAVETWDPALPFAAQIDGAVAVADVGAFLEREMIPLAGSAGVKLWQMISAGYDQLDLELFRANGIKVANTPGQFSAPALGEHALMLMLCVSKQFPTSQQHLREGRFYRCFGEELGGRTLGLVGVGASGRALAKLAGALGMEILGVDPLPPPEEQLTELGITLLGGPEELHALLARSDVVSIHVPLSEATRGMIGAGELAAMKPSAVLINVSRGHVVDQRALVAALRAGTIAGAGLDVFAVEPLPTDDPLLSMDNVVVTPHVAGSTYGTSRRRGGAAAENVLRAARGEDPLYVVS